jgi:hypothetical protein
MQQLGQLGEVIRARKSKALPVVLTRDEVKTVLNRLRGEQRLIAILMYGTGMRLMECLRLRVKDTDFGSGEILIRRGKGDKDRRTMLPEKVNASLREHLKRVQRIHALDLAAGFETSSDVEYGVATEDYYYYCGDTRRRLESTGRDGGGMIWAEYTGWSGNKFSERTDVHEGFFVGSEEQLKSLDAQKDQNSQPKVGPIDRSKLTCVAP